MLVTQAEIVERLPPWMRADFTCPARGAHEWLETGGARWATGVVYAFCKRCDAKKRTVDAEWEVTRPALEVIYDLMH